MTQVKVPEPQGPKPQAPSLSVASASGDMPTRAGDRRYFAAAGAATITRLVAVNTRSLTAITAATSAIKALP